MNLSTIRIPCFIFLMMCSGSVVAQDVLLLTENFELGSTFSLTGGGLGSDAGDNQWIVNNQYTGGGGYPNTTTQDNTNGGTISFAPTSNYLHIHDLPSGFTNANYDPTATSDRFAYMAGGICTYAMEDVHFSFFYLCEGSATAFGTIYYSLDGGPWTQFGLSQYSNMPTWQYVDITDPSFSNVGSLRFGFRWQNDNSATAFTQSFAVDDINIVASNATIDPVTIDILSISPNPVCQGSFITIEWQLSDTLCDGNYQIELSNGNGIFNGAFGSWVFGIYYPQTTGFVSIQIPTTAPVDDCYKIRINRLSPPPEITGTASACFEVIECPNIITTLQPVITLDTNDVCVNSAIDVPFTSTGVYANNNNYICQLSDVDGTFPSNPTVVGSSADNNTYDPALGSPPGTVSGLVPVVEPGCNYFLRVISTNPDAIGSVWGPFCIQLCDITTNNMEDLYFCVNECGTDPDGETQTIDVDVNTWDGVSNYLPGNIFTTQLLSSMDFSQIGPDGLLGSEAATDDCQLDVHIPCKDSLPIVGIPLGMNYMRVVATESSTPENSLGSLIRVTIGAYTETPQIITAYSYPDYIPQTSFCVGETVALIFSPYDYFANSTYMWTCNGINGGQPFESPSGANSNSLYVILGGAGTLNFSIQETNYACVSPWTPPMSITVLGDPIVNITGSPNVCQGDTASFQVNFYPDTYYSWSTNIDEEYIAYQDTANNVLNIAVNEPGNYMLEVNVLNLCGSGDDQSNINVIALPDVEAEPDTATICIGDNVQMNISTGTGTYSWTDETGDIIGTAQTQSVSPTEDSEYYAMVTGTGGCTNTDTVSITVLFPDPPILFYDSICPGGMNNLTLTTDAVGVYEWSTGDNTDYTIVSDTGTYLLSVYTAAICPDLFEYDVLPLEPEPAITFTDSICPGGQNDLTLYTDAIGTYVWSTGDNGIYTTVHDVGTYELNVYTDAVCPDLYIYDVLPMEPELPILLTDSVCPGGDGHFPITLEADAVGVYDWNTDQSVPVIWVNDTGVYVLNIYMPDSACPRILEFTVIPDSCYALPELFFYAPNSFTPNDDAVNDVFGPSFSDLSLLSEYRMLIFDRWGEVVFESNDPMQKWTGNFKNGAYFVHDGAYVWMIEYLQIDMAEKIKHVGHVVMLR